MTCNPNDIWNSNDTWWRLRMVDPGNRANEALNQPTCVRTPPIRANICGSPVPATRSSASAASHSGAPFSAFESVGDVMSGIQQRDEF